jgi:thiol-disulfide isomerase/thioredoxin
MKKLINVLLLFLLGLSAATQEKIKELTIGDRLPDLVITGAMNYPNGTFKLSDFKGKLIVFDFMATNCISCIQAFPHLQELQRTFNKDLQFIIVAKNNKQQWEQLAKKVKVARQLTLPLILDDKLLSSYFPHEYIPHEVWLNGNLEVIAITSSNYITASNIKFVLGGQIPDWPVKKDIGDYHFSTNLLVPMEEQLLSQPLYYSALAGQRLGTRSMSKKVVDSVNKIIRWTVINQPARILYRIAVERFGAAGIPNNRLIYELKNPGKFFSDSSGLFKENWKKENTWCYEAVVPIHTSKQELNTLMLEDLNRYTKYYGRIEKRQFECYVITCAAGATGASIRSNKPAPEKDYLKFDSYETIEDYVRELNMFSNLLPVVNETGNTSTLNIHVPKYTGSNIVEIERILKPFGLAITKTKRTLDAFVITEK